MVKKLIGRNKKKALAILLILTLMIVPVDQTVFATENSTSESSSGSSSSDSSSGSSSSGSSSSGSSTNSNSSTFVFDPSKVDTTQEENAAEQRVQQQYQQQIDSLENQTGALQEEIGALNSDLVGVLTSIEVLEESIAETEAQITETEAELVIAEQTIQAQYEAMKNRIKYTYERGETSLLEMVVESGSISDFLNRVEYANAVYDYDRNLLGVYQALKIEVQELKLSLENDEAQLQSDKAQLEAEKRTLNGMIAQKQGELTNFEAQLAAAKEEAKQKAAEAREQARIAAIKRAEQAAREQAARTATANGGGSSSGGSSSGGSSGGSSSGGSSGGSSSGSYTGGESMNPPFTTGISGGEVVAYANQWVGNPYVWGGTSLTEGCDCSGFVGQVFAHFGVFSQAKANSHGYTSVTLRSVGSPVSYDCIQPGDIVCYPGHVAIYMGGGTIVEAQSSATGITNYRSVTARTIVAIRRVL